MKRYWRALGFIMSTKKVDIRIALGVLAFIVTLVYQSQTLAGKSLGNFWSSFKGLAWWAEILDPILGTAVVLIALGIWLSKGTKEWKDSLENRLTVRFIFEGAEIMRCEHASLAHKSDIRNTAQQIGGQMSKTRLAIEPYFELSPHSVEFDEKRDRHYNYYEFTMYLYKKPKSLQGLSEDDLQDHQYIQQSKEGGILVWRIMNQKSTPPRAPSPSVGEDDTLPDEET